MGFPLWTLWGMGMSIAGALIFITLSWLGQSLQMTRRLGLNGLRLDLRVRAFTGFALATLLLAVAFFLAGVPLETKTKADTLAQGQATLETDTIATAASGANQNEAASEAVDSPLTPETGAFSGPPASRLSSDSEESSAAAGVSQVPRITVPAGLSAPGTNTTAAPATQPPPSATPHPTATATPRATETPYPTLTPTIIAGETAVISTSGSTLWLKRSPGGQNLTLVHDGDIVLLRAGRANQGGALWRQVATVSGVEGWLQEEFLALPGSESAG